MLKVYRAEKFCELLSVTAHQRKPSARLPRFTPAASAVQLSAPTQTFAPQSQLSSPSVQSLLQARTQQAPCTKTDASQAGEKNNTCHLMIQNASQYRYYRSSKWSSML